MATNSTATDLLEIYFISTFIEHSLFLIFEHKEKTIYKWSLPYVQKSEKKKFKTYAQKIAKIGCIHHVR